MDPEVKRQLDLRLAKGEITREDYSATLKALTEGDKSAAPPSIASLASGAFKDWLTRLKDPYGELNYKNVEPKDEAPLVVSDELSLFATTLKFRQTTLRYSDIRSLSFDGLRRTVNGGLSTYYARLGILPRSGEWIAVLGEWKHKAFGWGPSVTKVKLVENAYCFLAPLTFQQRLQRRLEEMLRNGYTDICNTRGKSEVRLFPDGLIQEDGLVINLREAHSNKAIKLGSSSFLHSSPDAFTFGQEGVGFLSRRISVKAWIDRDVLAFIITNLAEGRAICPAQTTDPRTHT
jgi:hypothetical protein